MIGSSPNYHQIYYRSEAKRSGALDEAANAISDALNNDGNKGFSSPPLGKYHYGWNLIN